MKMMNGMTINTKTIRVTPWWKTLLETMDCTLISLDVISIGMLVTSFVLIAKDKKETEVNE